MKKKCIRCKRKRLIYAKGLCNSCFVYSTSNPERVYKTNKIWRKKNKEYWKEYYQKNKEYLKVYAKGYFQMKMQEKEFVEDRRERARRYYNKNKKYWVEYRNAKKENRN
jgi:hypothetical protein